MIPYFYPKTGGLENYALQIANLLARNKKIEIIVITSLYNTSLKKIEIVGKIKIYRLPILFKLSNTPINPFWIRQIDEIIKIEKPEIINGHTPVPFMADIAAIIAKKNNIPYILTYQNDLFKDNKLLSMILKGYYTTLGKMTLSSAKNIIATSQYYANRSPYLKNYLKKVVIIPPGVHLETNNIVKRRKQNNKHILFVGQLDKTHKHKGLSVLIEAVAQAKNSINNIRLVVVGKGDNIDEYKHEVSLLKLTKYVTFTGFVKDDKLSTYYKDSDVVVLPSLNDSEGFGMTLIEAGGYKKPVIGSLVGGIPSVIDHEKTGVLVNPNNVAELSSAIIRIVNNKMLAKQFGEAGYKKVKKDYMWDKQASKTHKLFINTV